MNVTLDKRLASAETALGLRSGEGAAARRFCSGVQTFVATGSDESLADAFKASAGMSASERAKAIDDAAKRLSDHELYCILYAVTKAMAGDPNASDEDRISAKAQHEKLIEETLGSLKWSGCKLLHAPREEVDAYLSEKGHDEYYTGWRLRLLLAWGLIPLRHQPQAAH